MLKPRALRPGDTVAVVTPSSSIDEERLNKGLGVLHRAGYKTKIYPHVLDSHFYLGGTDEDRAKDLMAAFQDPECAAVYCSRGGYGCARLFPYLDLDIMAQSGKMFMGFSDISTMHIALNQKGLVTFHTPMALTLAYDREPWVIESFVNLLAGDPTIPAASKKGDTVVPGIAEGVLTGGCLCLLTDSIGTPYPLETEGKLLLIEDVDENPHRIDAMMTQLMNTGLLQKCAGIIVGEMTGTDERCDPTMGGRPWRSIIDERLLQVGVPSVVNFPFGHMKTMLSLPLGICGKLDADAGTLEYLESPVSG